jgi:hypothetical protein
VDRLSFFGDFEGRFYLDNVDVNGVLLEETTSPGYLLAVLNSTLLDWRFKQSSVPFRGDYFSANKQFIAGLPIREIAFTTPEAEREAAAQQAIDAYDDALATDDPAAVLRAVDDYLTAEPERADVVHDLLAHLARKMTDLHDERQVYDLDVLAYVGRRADGPRLPDAGVFQPASGNDADLLAATADDHEKLRIGRVRVERDGNAATVYATARYKPADPSDYDTDRYGYTESAPLEAFRLAKLSEGEAALIEHFVPAAAEEGGGFAEFRANATKTNSPLDRLKAMQLPDAGRVKDDLDRYVEAKQAADALDAKIAFTDDLIDQIVYRLYDLTDEEIAVVEE